jgi:hypothetical protein
MTCMFRAWAVGMLKCSFRLYSQLEPGCRGRGLLGMITSATFCMPFWMILTDWPLWRCWWQHKKARRSKSHSKCHVAVGLGYVAHFVPGYVAFNGRGLAKLMWAEGIDTLTIQNSNVGGFWHWQRIGNLLFRKVWFWRWRGNIMRFRINQLPLRLYSYIPPHPCVCLSLF